MKVFVIFTFSLLCVVFFISLVLVFCGGFFFSAFKILSSSFVPRSLIVMGLIVVRLDVICFFICLLVWVLILLGVNLILNLWLGVCHYFGNFLGSISSNTSFGLFSKAYSKYALIRFCSATLYLAALSNVSSIEFTQFYVCVSV